MRPSKSVLLKTTSIVASNITTVGLDLQQMYGYSIQAIWTGAALVGTVKLQASLDYNPATGFSGTWSDIGGSTEVVNGPGSFVWNVSNVFYPYVRLVFTYTSGSGAITVYQFAKGP